MKVPLSWLKEFVDVDLPLDDLLELMGRNGLEVEEVRTPGAGVAGVRAARVLAVESHPRADKLVVATVDDGDGEHTVCAGARNFRAGDRVPFAPPGATLPGGLRIEAREMRGVVSDGMLCSARELEVATDHSGIMILDGDPEPGTDIHDILPLGEPVIDVAVQADRGDLQSVLGVARDLAAILGLDVRIPRVRRAERERRDDGPVPVRIDAGDGCSVYVGWVVEGLAVGPSPWWLRRRLEACGVRSISNLVDVTNYVMLELGQPLHAFDLDRLRGPEIVVRWARAGEPITTLDGRDRALEATDLVIADHDRAVALAGVMGGEDTEVGSQTRRVLLEAAVFDSSAVRRTSRRLGLVSESSMRFERGIDPEGTWRAAARAVDLLLDLAGGADGGVRVASTGKRERPTIRFDTGWSARFLGLPDLGGDDQAALLRRAGVTVEPARDGVLEVTPPSWRGDLRRPADVAEEVARLYGYEKIPSTLPPVSQRGGSSARQRAERDVRGAVLALGFHEVQTSPFVGADAWCLLAPDDEARVTLQNPLTKDAATMRPGLVEGLLAVARRNSGQGRAGLAAFELGRIFRPAGGALDAVAGRQGAWRWTGPDGQPLPTQPLTLGLIAYGVRQGRDWMDRSALWGVADLLAALDEVLARLTPDPDDPAWRLERVPTERAGLHPGRTVALRWQGDEVGVAGQLHPHASGARDLPEATSVAELLLEPLWQHLAEAEPPPRQAPSIVRHPALTLDVAVVAPESLPYADVEAAVRAGAGRLLERLWWFDEFRGPQVGADRRSLAFHLRLQDPQRQLTDADADAVIDDVARAVEEVGGSLRR